MLDKVTKGLLNVLVLGTVIAEAGYAGIAKFLYFPSNCFFMNYMGYMYLLATAVDLGVPFTVTVANFYLASVMLWAMCVGA